MEVIALAIVGVILALCLKAFLAWDSKNSLNLEESIDVDDEELIGEQHQATQ